VRHFSPLLRKSEKAYENAVIRYNAHDLSPCSRRLRRRPVLPQGITEYPSPSHGAACSKSSLSLANLIARCRKEQHAYTATAIGMGNLRRSTTAAKPPPYAIIARVSKNPKATYHGRAARLSRMPEIMADALTALGVSATAAVTVRDVLTCHTPQCDRARGPAVAMGTYRSINARHLQQSMATCHRGRAAGSVLPASALRGATRSAQRTIAKRGATCS
jgi:hypothetical protein